MPESSVRFKVRARGPMACFTRPELKVERVSYEIMTPSAARGILEAVLWKPAIRWRIEQIHVLNPIRFGQLRRNEVNSKLSTRGDHSRYFADEDRAQRNTLFLKDVDYVMFASFELTTKAGADETLTKFEDIFRRRLERGQQFHQPYLGCREFAAIVEPAPDRWETDPSLRGERHLGLVLLDIDHADAPRPVFFDATLRDGVLDVPPLQVTSQ